MGKSKPSKPTPPKKPVEPSKTMELKSQFIRNWGSYDVITIQDIRDACKERGFDPELAYLDIDVEYGYGRYDDTTVDVRLYSGETQVVPNPNYDVEMARYEKALKAFPAKQKAYKEKLARYKAELADWEKRQKEAEVARFKKQEAKLKAEGLI